MTRLKLTFEPKRPQEPTLRYIGLGQWFRWRTNLCYKSAGGPVFVINEVGSYIETAPQSYREDETELISIDRISITVAS